jgi:hypothetical protein
MVGAAQGGTGVVIVSGEGSDGAAEQGGTVGIIPDSVRECVPAVLVWAVLVGGAPVWVALVEVALAWVALVAVAPVWVVPVGAVPV